MKLEKETYTREEVKEFVSWLMNKCERDQERYMADERFIMEYLEYPFWKRLFFGRQILLNHLNQTLMFETSNPNIEEV